MDYTRIRRNLESRGYIVSLFPTAEEAVAYMDCAVNGKTIGFGGSVTTEEMGLYDVLSEHNTVFHHWHVKPGESVATTQMQAQRADIYISSVNGIAETGEIVNIDGTGNRVGSIMYGHQRVYLLIGKNKIAPTYEEALHRARNVAAPKNAQRLGKKTPCAPKADRCYDCASPDRICRVLSVLWENPVGTQIEILLIDEELGY